MKLTTSIEILNDAVTTASRAVSSRPTHPILGCLLLDFEKGKPFLFGFDLRTAIKVKFDADFDEQISVAIPCNVLKDIVSRLPKEGGIALSIEEGQSILKIKTASGEFSISVMGSLDFPSMPMANPKDKTVALSTESFKDGVKFCLPSASTDETKQILTGVNIQRKEAKLGIAATNGHRLACVSYETKEGDEFSLTIPGAALSDVLNALPPEQKEIEFQVSESLAVFNLGNITISSRILGGAYPLYEQLIPANFDYLFTADRREIIQALKLLSVLATDKSKVVLFEWKNRGLTLSVASQDVGNGTQTIPSASTSYEFTVAFNIPYLLQGLSSFDSGEIEINANTDNQPVVITAPSDSDKIYLVMPIKIRE